MTKIERDMIKDITGYFKSQQKTLFVKAIYIKINLQRKIDQNRDCREHIELSKNSNITLK